MTTRGGYRPDGRIQTLKDELLIEALIGANHPSDEVRQRTFEEIARLARRVGQLLAHGGGQNPALAWLNA
jgi:hypothetical protein